jgi:hypothetical protein
MRIFRACPAPHNRPWRLAVWTDSGSAGNPDSAVDNRKKLRCSRFFAKIVSKHSLFQVFADENAYADSGNNSGNNSGINSGITAELTAE